MSQPKNFGPHEVDPLEKPIHSVADLESLFYETERRDTPCLLGIEYEVFGQIDAGQKPLPFLGPVSIQTLFHSLATSTKKTDDPWTPYIEHDSIVALMGKRAVIALEPGGQIEIAARPDARLFDASSHLEQVVQEISHHAKRLGIDLFALGIHPWAGRQDMAQVEKARYGVMRSYMSGLLGRGLDMMTRSCAIQINLDFKSESDMAKKTKLAACLVPWYGLFSSSVAYIDKKPAPCALERGHVWRHTDPSRTGIPGVIFARDFGYRAWIEFALDVPMYFIRRGSTYHGVPGASFRSFMKNGLLGMQASMRDFVDHLSCIFTEIRLKPILELRTPDSLPLPMVHAFSALSFALFYDHQAHEHALEFFADMTHEELIALRNDVIDHGQAAQFRKKPVFDTAAKILDWAQAGLDRVAEKENQPCIKTWLTPLKRLVEQQTTYAEWIKTHYAKLDTTTLPCLIKDFDPLNDPLQ